MNGMTKVNSRKGKGSDAHTGEKSQERIHWKRNWKS
jgi:hypothetical protein